MSFQTKLRVEPIRGTTKRKLLSELAYQDILEGRLEAPRGFITDYASVPSVIPRWFIDQDAPFIRDASVIHDYLYSDVCKYRLTREEADAVFYRAMLGLCKGYWDTVRAKSAWLAVRLTGASYYSTPFGDVV